MGLHVGAQIGAVGKRLAAVGATVWLFSCVRPEMALQQPRPRKQLAAHIAAVRQLVRQNVHGQRGHRDVRLAAHVALFGRLRVKAAVCLLVPGQIA